MCADDRQEKQNERYMSFSCLEAFMTSNADVTTGKTQKVVQQGALLVFI